MNIYKNLNLADLCMSDDDYSNSVAGSVIEEFLKVAPAYLVYASGVRWDRSDGYKIVDSIPECFRRSYPASIYPQEASRGRKILRCTEYSHDVPMGSTTYVIALTGSEYKRLNSWDTEFDDVVAFVEKTIRNERRKR